MTLLVCEIVSRIWVPTIVIQKKEKELYFNLMDYHPELDRVLKKDYSTRILGRGGIDFSVSTNSNGLRDRNFEYYKSEDVFRILVLGDSFTFGYGVEEDCTYPKLLEKKLRKEFPTSEIEVINSGITGPA